MVQKWGLDYSLTPISTATHASSSSDCRISVSMKSKYSSRSRRNVSRSRLVQLRSNRNDSICSDMFVEKFSWWAANASTNSVNGVINP